MRCETRCAQLWAGEGNARGAGTGRRPPRGMLTRASRYAVGTGARASRAWKVAANPSSSAQSVYS